MVETCQRLAEFANSNGIVLEIRHTSIAMDNSPYGSCHFMASLGKIEVRYKGSSGILSSITGRGRSPTEAIFDLALKLQGENLVYRAWATDKREEFRAPTLVCSHESKVV